MKRTFLGWEKACLPALVELLLKRHHQPDSTIVDLSQYMFVFPSRFANRRFLTLLADYSYQHQVTIDPPRVRQVADFLELLYEQKKPFASPLTQEIVWMQALREVQKRNPDWIGWMFPEPPADDDILSWLDLGTHLAEIYQELVRDSVDFESVLNICLNFEKDETSHFPESETCRWRLLAEVQREYHRILDSLEIWDKQSARLFALHPQSASSINPKDFQIDYQIGMVGCVELSQIQREFLKKVSRNVEIFIYAPEDWAEKFEDDGSLVPGAWSRIEPTLNEKLKSVTRQVTSPEDQAQAVVTWLRDVAPRYVAEDVTIGMADETLEPILLQILRLNGVPAPLAAKKLLSDMQPWKLLKFIAAYLEDAMPAARRERAEEEPVLQPPKYSNLALLLRHPDLETYLRNSCNLTGDWLAELDDYYFHFLPDRMPSPENLNQKTHGAYPHLVSAYTAVNTLLEEAIQNYVHFDSTLSVVTHLLRRVYCWKTFYNSDNDAEYQIIRGCIDINHSFAEKMQIPQGLYKDIPLTLPQALRLLLQETINKPISFPTPPGTVNIQRWIDLMFDDAGAMVITGVNEGIVPESINEDIFLPNQLRSALHSKTNEIRFERYIYNLSAILASHKDVGIIFGRLGADENPLLPSRVLLTDTSPALISQVQEYFTEPSEEPEYSEVSSKSANSAPSFSSPYTPPPVTRDDCEIPNHFSVSEFSTYLKNPYVYYLKHIQKLRVVDDSDVELSGGAFGDLAHRVLQRFGQNEIHAKADRARAQVQDVRRETDRIAAQLTSILNKEYERFYDNNTLPVVPIQKAQLMERLRIFAGKQAEWAANGWEIFNVEIPFENIPMRYNSGVGEELKCNGQSILISGKIDRIDYCPETKEWAIWDYKTADRGFTPEETHHGYPLEKIGDKFSSDLWVDLQLPLYRHLVFSSRYNNSPEFLPLHEITAHNLRLGYILLPQQLKSIGFCEAHWQEEHFRSASNLAEEVVRNIFACKFPIKEERMHLKTEFDWIMKR